MISNQKTKEMFWETLVSGYILLKALGAFQLQWKDFYFLRQKLRWWEVEENKSMQEKIRILQRSRALLRGGKAADTGVSTEPTQEETRPEDVFGLV